MDKPRNIIEYLLENFNQVGRLSANGREFVMPSIFVLNDYKCHFSINIDSGLWQDFKTGETGNFAKFLTIVENISYERAKEKIFLMDFMPEKAKVQAPSPKVQYNLEELLPVNLDSHSSDNDIVVKAWMLLYERKLFNLDSFEEEPYYVSREGKYKNRLVIPFKNDKGSVFFFQARALEGQTPKYLNPCGDVKPSNILYPFDESKEYVVVCEGPLDAISLQLEGVNATCTMGCTVSEAQAEILRYFDGKIILGYDNDEAGRRGIEKFETLRKDKIMPEFHITPLPSGCKDWNDARIKVGNLSEWVKNNCRRYDFDYRTSYRLNLL
jgi:hypothetical protein